jgi:hypothetical protein
VWDSIAENIELLNLIPRRNFDKPLKFKIDPSGTAWNDDLGEHDLLSILTADKLYIRNYDRGPQTGPIIVWKRDGLSDAINAAEYTKITLPPFEELQAVLSKLAVPSGPGSTSQSG